MFSPTQRPLTDNTQHSQETDINVSGGFESASELPHNPRPLGSAMVSESGLKLYAGNEKESCEGGNIKASYGSVSYLARKLNHLLHCIGKKRNIAGKNGTDDCLQYFWLQNFPQSCCIPTTTITKNLQIRVHETTVHSWKESSPTNTSTSNLGALRFQVLTTGNTDFTGRTCSLVDRYQFRGGDYFQHP